MTSDARGRVRPAGKSFTKGNRPFRFRGVTYGTFREADDGALFPDRHQVKLDFGAIREKGFTVVRTYTEPPDRVLEAAADWGIQLLVGVFFEDWRYLVGCSSRQRRALEAKARKRVEAAADRLVGCDQVLALCVGNEVPADVVRWLGPSTLGRALGDLVRAVHDTDPEQLATYANYPTSEYLAVDEQDFVSFNVFLDDRAAFRRYVTRLQHLADNRPLVLSEVGAPSGRGVVGETYQAEAVEWQLSTALERGVGGTCVFSWTDDWWVAGESQEAWGFGLTRSDRSPKPALSVADRWNHSSVSDLDFPWPSITVAVCAYNAASTLDECLRHTCALDYPNLEILVIDDGSRDETAAIARRHPRARLVEVPHGGLSVARNVAIKEASGELVAYLDSDAYPEPDWPYYLALGLDGPRVGGVGGPNLPPQSDPPVAQRVAASPGGPVHVMLSDDRAEHVPGCNMAFWRDVLVAAGGFDPIYTSAGDDVDVSWRILDRGWEIAFHPAAVVWHHPRCTTRAYLRQQVGYGRSEALVEGRHPDRFTPAGGARWRGSVYRPPGGPSHLTRQRIYRGVFGSAAYQSVYRGGGDGLDLAHQVGVPIATVALATAVLSPVSPYLALPAVVALVALFALFVTDATRCKPPSRLREGRLAYRLHVGMLHVLQPLARGLGRRQRNVPDAGIVPTDIGRQRGFRVKAGIVVLREDRPRPEIVADLVASARRAHLRVLPGTGWEDHDAHVSASLLVKGELMTSSHPPGWVQLRIRPATRKSLLATIVAFAAVLGFLAPLAGMVLAALAAADVLRGGIRVRKALGVLTSSETK
jgi:GT2 family glycosyltransferase